MNKAVDENIETPERTLNMKKAVIEDIDTPEKKAPKTKNFEVVLSFAHPNGAFNKGRILTENEVKERKLSGYIKLGYIKKVK